MSDIVERLKYHSGWTERSPYMGQFSELLWDAINEIERLRRPVVTADWRANCHTGEELDAETR